MTERLLRGGRVVEQSIQFSDNSTGTQAAQRQARVMHGSLNIELVEEISQVAAGPNTVPPQKPSSYSSSSSPFHGTASLLLLNELRL
jgi:hypothetical protein